MTKKPPTIIRKLSSVKVKDVATSEKIHIRDFKNDQAHQLLQTLEVNVPKTYSPLLDKFFSAEHISSLKSIEDYKSTLNQWVPFPWKDTDVKMMYDYFERFKDGGFPKDLLSGDKNCPNMILLRENEFLDETELVSVQTAENVLNLLQKNRNVYSEYTKRRQFYKVCNFYKAQKSGKKKNKKVVDNRRMPINIIVYVKNLLSDETILENEIDSIFEALRANFEHDSMMLWECE